MKILCFVHNLYFKSGNGGNNGGENNHGGGDSLPNYEVGCVYIMSRKEVTYTKQVSIAVNRGKTMW